MKMGVKDHVRAAPGRPADGLRVAPALMTNCHAEDQAGHLENAAPGPGRIRAFFRWIDLPLILEPETRSVPVYHKGELVATRQQFDERLTCFLLSARNKQASSPTREEYDRLHYWADKLPELITRVEKSGELPSEED